MNDDRAEVKGVAWSARPVSCSFRCLGGGVSIVNSLCPSIPDNFTTMSTVIDTRSPHAGCGIQGNEIRLVPVVGILSS